MMARLRRALLGAGVGEGDHVLDDDRGEPIEGTERSTERPAWAERAEREARKAVDRKSRQQEDALRRLQRDLEIITRR